MDVANYFSKVPQSVLISGTSLADVTSFVENWSARLLKTSPQSVSKHPDFYVIHPTNKMRQINVEALRDLNRNVYLSSQQGGHKVFVIYEADRLNVAASNALLKTLEEPAPATSLFLATLRPYDLLPTLRSRCWWVQLPTLANTSQGDLQTILELFRACVQSYVNGNIIQPLEIYGLLYRLHSYIDQKKASLKFQNDTMKEEEQTAQKARLEKQCVQEIFIALERTLSQLIHDMPENNVLKSLYPSWVQSLETCFRRTEVNFGVVPALESFLLPFCKSL